MKIVKSLVVAGLACAVSCSQNQSTGMSTIQNSSGGSKATGTFFDVEGSCQKSGQRYRSCDHPAKEIFQAQSVSAFTPGGLISTLPFVNRVKALYECSAFKPEHVTFRIGSLSADLAPSLGGAGFEVDAKVSSSGAPLRVEPHFNLTNVYKEGCKIIIASNYQHIDLQFLSLFVDIVGQHLEAFQDVQIEVDGDGTVSGIKSAIARAKTHLGRSVTQQQRKLNRLESRGASDIAINAVTKRLNNIKSTIDVLVARSADLNSECSISEESDNCRNVVEKISTKIDLITTKAQASLREIVEFVILEKARLESVANGFEDEASGQLAVINSYLSQ